MKIKKYIAKIIENSSSEDMEKLSDMLDSLICDLKEKNPLLYKKYKDELYCMAYGPKINDDIAKDIIKKIGEHWSYEETENVRNKYDYDDLEPLDFYVTMNMAYSDFKEVFDDDLDLYAKFSKSFIDDKDAVEGKLYYYFSLMLKED